MKGKQLVAFVAVAIVLAILTPGSAVAQNGANKVHTSGSTVATFPLNTTATLLSTTIKTSTNADLLISFTSECDLGIGDLDESNRTTFTQNSNFNSSFANSGGGSASSSAFSTANATALTQESDQAVAQVRVWVELDGVPVRIQANNPDGSVVLCRKSMSDFTSDRLNLSTGLNTSLSTSVSVFSTASTFVSTNTNTSTGTSTQVGISETDFRFNAGAHANGFNWAAQNVGQGTHTVVVKAHVFSFIGNSAGAFAGGGGSGQAFGNAGASGSGGGFADNGFGGASPPFITGAIGKRTLVVEPVNMGK